jgi:hypothetical protein
VTKAAFEDVELRIFLFNECQIDFKLKRYSSSKDYEHIFAVYFIKTTLLTFKKFEKLHEDLQYDLKEDFNKLLTKIHSGNLANIALELGLPTQI